ncbi:YbhB/YbcL family Raf kinase inhibitor-like protein [Weissella soli]|jgi:Raf kinase inhibitor-like YbhB/YbcL family protein|uniref:YbhB/YbcL family Raf kinase inhibitor-like protein n=1 Tax=Weissella soli TaxID=155866 RepID=UPI0011BB677B|nr:YbhB/YbcL family Raf kinase inhibitor-like protein [Weissella soli]QEA35402.1 YbhB/YbcL family Raf kinase inhibitor-like protein [Weissella soli]
MKLSVELEHGLLPDKYGKFAGEEYRAFDVPVVNFPIEITDIPAGTQTLSVSLIDYDAVPVGGFPWIHWLAANLPVEDIAEDLAHGSLTYVKGTNSFWSKVKDNPALTQAYIGPMPPDQTHNYTLSVFALDAELDLADGFFLNELRNASVGHVLDIALLDLPSRAN